MYESKCMKVFLPTFISLNITRRPMHGKRRRYYVYNTSYANIFKEI